MDKSTLDRDIKLKNKEKRIDGLFVFCALIIPILHWLFFTGYVNVTMFIRSFTKVKLNGDIYFSWDNYKFIFSPGNPDIRNNPRC